MGENSELDRLTDAFSPAVLRNVDPKSPAPVRMMAAKGLLGCPPRELMTAIYVLTFDPDPKVIAAANQFAATVPERILAALRDDELDPSVLALFGRSLIENEKAMEIVALNSATPDSFIVDLAAVASEPIAEIIASNQMRILREEEIVRSLVRNPNIRLATLDTLLDFCVRSGLEMPDLPEYHEARQRVLGTDPVAAEQILEAERHTAEKIVRDLGAAVTDEDAELDDGTRLTFTQRVMKMSVMQKIKLATLGNKEARTMLLRDSNKLVALAAITSPRISDSEVVALSNNRTLHDDVMRILSRNREWTKIYQVKVNLVNNPKCPPYVGLKLITFLHASDLKAAARNKNIPQMIQLAAKREMHKREGH